MSRSLIRPLAAACLLSLAVPAVAQDMEGTIEATLDGTTTTFEVTDTTREAVADSTMWTLTAEASDGTALTLVFGPVSDEALPRRVRIVWQGEETYAANARTGGRLDVRRLETDGSVVTDFHFGGLVVPVQIIDGGALAPVEAQQGVTLDGTFSGRLDLE